MYVYSFVCLFVCMCVCEYGVRECLGLVHDSRSRFGRPGEPEVPAPLYGSAWCSFGYSPTWMLWISESGRGGLKARSQRSRARLDDKTIKQLNN